MKIQNKQRDEYIFNERQKGRTYKDIGEEVGLSTQRVRQICMQIGRDRRERFGCEQYIVSNHYTVGNAEVIVYRPAPGTITEEERKKRKDRIIHALTEFGKDRARRRMEKENATAL